MSKNILITGGAGFIGSHLCDELLEYGYNVRVLDSLIPQVHGANPKRPDYLNQEVEFVQGDVRDRDLLKKVLKGIDAVYHFAAKVGVGQSMYEVDEYTSVNNMGTANLLQVLIEQPVQRLVVASSMSIYGEGLYRATSGEIIQGKDRSVDQLKAHKWDLQDDKGEKLTPIPTPETKEPGLASVYALSKYDQERLCILVGRAYKIPTVALRFFNVYGTRQALSNPYSGVLAIFASRLLNNKPPMIFEDGYQRRDFVSVHDIVQGCRLALQVPGAADHVFNLGSGENFSIRQVAEKMATVIDKENLLPEVTEEYRVGDIRHCFADICQAKTILGYRPVVTLEEGLEELAAWLEGQVAVDNVAAARAELSARGLTV